MKDFPTVPVYYVIHDIERDLYVQSAMRSKQDPGQGSVQWDTDPSKCIHADNVTAHEIRAIAIGVGELQGGRPEEMVRIVPAPLPADQPVSVPVAAQELFLLYNPVAKGWYYKQEFLGDQVRVTWTSNPQGAYYLNKAMAEMIADRESIPRENIKPKSWVDEMFIEQARMTGRITRLHDVSPAKPSREYTLVIGTSPGELNIAVTRHLGEGWDVSGGVTIDKDGILFQPMLRTVPVEA